jgi:hypothetical protein
MLHGSLSQCAPQGKLQAPWWLQDHPHGSAHGAQGTLHPLPQRVCSQETEHFAVHGGQGLPLWQLLLQGWPQDSGLLHFSLQEACCRVKLAGRRICCCWLLLLLLLLLLLASTRLSGLLRRCCNCCSQHNQLVTSLLRCLSISAATAAAMPPSAAAPLPAAFLPPPGAAPCRNFSSCCSPPTPAICSLHSAASCCASAPSCAPSAATHCCISFPRLSPMHLPQLDVQACKQPSSSTPQGSLQPLRSTCRAAALLQAQLRVWPHAGRVSCTVAGQVCGLAVRCAAAVQLVVWVWPTGSCTVTCALQEIELGSWDLQGSSSSRMRRSTGTCYNSHA